jgi:hypothetical protein
MEIGFIPMLQHFAMFASQVTFNSRHYTKHNFSVNEVRRLFQIEKDIRMILSRNPICVDLQRKRLSQICISSNKVINNRERLCHSNSGVLPVDLIFYIYIKSLIIG